MKFLCVCDGGNVRSASLAFILREVYKQEAIAIGRQWASSETWNTLGMWADCIVLMQSKMIKSVPLNLHSKSTFVDVGEDVYGYPLHPDLLKQTEAGAAWLVKANAQVT